MLIFKTNEEHEIKYDKTQAFSKPYSPFVNGDISINYRINKRKVSYGFVIKIPNAGMRRRTLLRI